MTGAAKIAAARALIEPLTGHTPAPWVVRHHVEEDPEYARIEPEVGYLAPPDYLSVSGLCSPPTAKILAAAPDLRDTVADLADLAEAQAQENAKLRGLLWYAWYEFNVIRARDGAPRGPDGCCGRLGPALVREEWWSAMTEAFADAIGEGATTPWPSPEARAALDGAAP